MKNFLIAGFALFLLSPITRTSYASNERIYIAELFMEDDLQTAKTLISIFKPDGAKLKRYLSMVVWRGCRQMENTLFT